jgi:small subunit ribosomal protein S20
MANHKSALKEHRQALQRRQRNRQQRSRMRTAIKKLRHTLEAGDAEAARGLLPATLSLVDRSVRRGGVHAKAAARTKSRLTRAVNKLSA